MKISSASSPVWARISAASRTDLEYTKCPGRLRPGHFFAEKRIFLSYFLLNNSSTRGKQYL